MKISVRRYSVVATGTVAALCLLLLSMAVAQNRRGTGDLENKPTPRTAAGHPDLSGYWVGAVAGISNADPNERLTQIVAEIAGGQFGAGGGADIPVPTGAPGLTDPDA